LHTIKPHQSTNRRKFFLGELNGGLELKNLLHEAYILVKHVGLSYGDVKSLSRTERSTFIQLLSEENQREQDAINKHNRSN
jgi:hypothetical protein